MRSPEKIATIATTVIILLIVGGVSLQSWRQDHDWRFIDILVAITAFVIPYSVFIGRNMLRGWFGKQMDEK